MFQEETSTVKIYW